MIRPMHCAVRSEKEIYAYEQAEKKYKRKRLYQSIFTGALLLRNIYGLS